MQLWVHLLKPLRKDWRPLVLTQRLLNYKKTVLIHISRILWKVLEVWGLLLIPYIKSETYPLVKNNMQSFSNNDHNKNNNADLSKSLHIDFIISQICHSQVSIPVLKALWIEWSPQLQILHNGDCVFSFSVHLIRYEPIHIWSIHSYN